MKSQTKNDRKIQNEHEARMVTQAIQTIGEAISVQDKLQNANLSESSKAYLQGMYDGLMEKQEKLNEKSRICRPGINEKKESVNMGCEHCEYVCDTPLGSYCTLTHKAIEITECCKDEQKTSNQVKIGSVKRIMKKNRTPFLGAD